MPAPMPTPRAAKYAGKCRRCPERIVEGQPIIWTRETGTYCMGCYVAEYGDEARRQIGEPVGPRPVVDRAAHPSAPPAPVKRLRTYQELFGDDDD